MTDNARVLKGLKAVGIPGTKFAWPIGKAPPLPWFVYYRDDDAIATRRGAWTYADNDNYFVMPRYVAELYVRENDPELVAAFAEAVLRLGNYTYREEWLEGENCMMHRFAFTLLPESED